MSRNFSIASTPDWEDDDDDIVPSYLTTASGFTVSVPSTNVSSLSLATTSYPITLSSAGFYLRNSVFSGSPGVLGAKKEDECNSEDESESSLSNVPIPDAVSPILATRFWIVTPRGVLGSSAQEYPWKPGPQRATCKKTGRRSTPEHLEGCQCGFYGLTSLWGLDSVSEQQNYKAANRVDGLIHLWGTVVEYERGCRGEFAEIVALVSKAQPKGFFKTMTEDPDVLKAAALYDVPIISREMYEKRIPVLPR